MGDLDLILIDRGERDHEEKEGRGDRRGAKVEFHGAHFPGSRMVMWSAGLSRSGLSFTLSAPGVFPAHLSLRPSVSVLLHVPHVFNGFIIHLLRYFIRQIKSFLLLLRDLLFS